MAALRGSIEIKLNGIADILELALSSARTRKQLERNVKRIIYICRKSAKQKGKITSGL